MEEHIQILHYCATLIQKVFRGYLARQFYSQLKQIIYEQLYADEQNNLECSESQEEMEHQDQYYDQPQIPEKDQNELSVLQQGNYYKNISDGYIYTRNHRYQSANSQNSIFSKNQQNDISKQSKMKIIDTSPHEETESNQGFVSYNQVHDQRLTHSKESNTSKVIKIPYNLDQSMKQNNKLNNTINTFTAQSTISQKKGFGKVQKHKILYHFDIYIISATKIQALFRGFKVRWIQKLNYYVIKRAVIRIENFFIQALKQRNFNSKQALKSIEQSAINIAGKMKQFQKIYDFITTRKQKNKDFLIVKHCHSSVLIECLHLLESKTQKLSKIQKINLITKIQQQIEDHFEGDCKKSQFSMSSPIKMKGNENKIQAEIDELKFKYQNLLQTHEQTMKQFIDHIKQIKK